jgi:hypothetical protein
VTVEAGVTVPPSTFTELHGVALLFGFTVPNAAALLSVARAFDPSGDALPPAPPAVA